MPHWISLKCNGFFLVVIVVLIELQFLVIFGYVSTSCNANYWDLLLLDILVQFAENVNAKQKPIILKVMQI